MKKVTKTQQIRNYMQEHPTATTDQIAKACKVTKQYVYQVRADEKKRNAVKKPKTTIKLAPPVDSLPKVGDSIGGLTLTRKISDDGNGYVYRWVRDSMVESGEVPVDSSEDPRVPKFDNVNHPSHYKAGGIETIDFIEAKDLGYHLGNVIKYITRAKHKGNEVEDLKKAQWYLNRAISKLTGDIA